MEYTVQELAQLAGVSSRTIRYYDEIDLLKPVKINASGYRIYSQKEVDRLQQILFYRELDVKLEEIKRILNAPSFDELQALKKHRENLLQQKQRLDLLIANVEKSIKAKERGIMMMDKEKFEGFKEKLLAENERKYGQEIREKYGEEAVNRSYERFKNMSQEEYQQATEVEKEFLHTLQEAFKLGDPAAELAQKAAELHRQWLSFYWDHYSPEAHAGLVQMYFADERFKRYYDREQAGITEFLRDAVLIYTKMEK